MALIQFIGNFLYQYVLLHLRSFLHKLAIAGEIYLIAAIGLVIFAVIFKGIRRVRTGKSVANTPFTAADVEAAKARAALNGRLHRWLVGFDIFLNITFFNGQMDETMSAHCWRAAQKGKLWGKLMNAWLDCFQTNHGPLAASGDLQRAEARVECEKKALGL